MPRTAAAALAALLAFLLPPATTAAAAQGSALDHVVVIVMENHSYDEVIGGPGTPYLNSLLPTSAVAQSYFAVAHPSLPNYLALTGGSTFGIASDCTTCHVAARNLGDTLEASGLSWRAYMESMPAPCYAPDSYPYAQRHNPFVYYDDIRGAAGRCAAHVVPYTQLAGDFASAAGAPAFAWITPNVCNDMHDCSVATGDAWLRANLPPILGSPAFAAGRSVAFIVWDEDDASAGNRVALIATGPGAAHGYRATARYDHYSLLHTVEAELGAASLGALDAGAPILSEMLAQPCGAPAGGPGGTGGYLVLSGTGAVYGFGDACVRGDLIQRGYPGPAIGIASTRSGGGYSILTSPGGLYSFGDAQYFGNLIDHGYPGPAVALAFTPSGGGYAILTSFGGLYTFGDARYYGNLVDHGYPGRAVGLSMTPSGHGYAILTDGGGLYTFGDAQYLGNLIDHRYPGPATSFSYTEDGLGYSILTAFGGIYSFGDAAYYGNLIDHYLPGPAIALTNTP